MARYSGIYLNLEGTTIEIDSLQQPRETAWDTTSGMFRYMDAASGIHYIGSSGLLHGVTTNYLAKSTGSTTFGNSIIRDDGSQIKLGPSALGLNALAVFNGPVLMSGLGFDMFSVDPYALLNGPVSSIAANSILEPTSSLSWIVNSNKNSVFISNAGYGPAATIAANGGDILKLTDSSLKNFVVVSGDGRIGIGDGTYSTPDSSARLKVVGNVFMSGEVYTDAWQSYSSTISGFSSTPLSRTRYKTVGKLVYVTVEVSGVGNGSGTTVSLPYQADTNANFNFLKVGAGYLDSGTWNPHYYSSIRIASGAFNADIKIADATYGTSGGDVYGDGTTLKYVCGTFWYERI